MKGYRTVQVQGWESDKDIFLQVVESAKKVVHSYLQVGGDQNRHSAKLLLRNLIKKTEVFFSSYFIFFLTKIKNIFKLRTILEKLKNTNKSKLYWEKLANKMKKKKAMIEKNRWSFSFFFFFFFLFFSFPFLSEKSSIIPQKSSVVILKKTLNP